MKYKLDRFPVHFRTHTHAPFTLTPTPPIDLNTHVFGLRRTVLSKLIIHKMIEQQAAAANHTRIYTDSKGRESFYCSYWLIRVPCFAAGALRCCLRCCLACCGWVTLTLTHWAGRCSSSSSYCGSGCSWRSGRRTLRPLSLSRSSGGVAKHWLTAPLSNPPRARRRWKRSTVLLSH